MTETRWVVAFDGDDTLWKNESNFETSYGAFRELVTRHVSMEPGHIDRVLLGTERRNLKSYGYGIKGFVLSMVETAIHVTDARIPAADIGEILELGRRMLDYPMTLIDGAEEVIGTLRAAGHEVWLITKGDLFDQESKVARSGLADMFDRVEIISEKNPATYRRLLDTGSVGTDRFVMVGNSIRSDILPVIELGARAIHIPHPLTWEHEKAEPPTSPLFVGLERLSEVPGAL